MMISGNIKDDYGFSSLKLYYKKDDDKKYASRNIPFNQKSLDQNFFYLFDTKELELKPGERLQFYVSVWDNDRVNGFKMSSTQKFEFKIPSNNEIDKKIDEANTEAEQNLDDAGAQLKDLKK